MCNNKKVLKVSDVYSTGKNDEISVKVLPKSGSKQKKIKCYWCSQRLNAMSFGDHMKFDHNLKSLSEDKENEPGNKRKNGFSTNDDDSLLEPKKKKKCTM